MIFLEYDSQYRKGHFIYFRQFFVKELLSQLDPRSIYKNKRNRINFDVSFLQIICNEINLTVYSEEMFLLISI